MNTGMKVGAALLGVVAVFASVEFSTGSILPNVSAQVHGVGEAVAYSAEDPIVSTVYGEPMVEGCQSCQICESSQPEPQCGCQAKSQCGCQECGCRQFKSQYGCKSQYDECQHCELKTKKVEEDKSFFKVEQKEVCVPAVRLPWMKHCPPKRSRVRTVNVLKKDKYKTKKCEYKWSVHEPEEYGASSQPTPASGGSDSKSSGGSATKSSGGSGSKTVDSYPDPSAEIGSSLELSDPDAALGEIPRPPLEK